MENSFFLSFSLNLKNVAKCGKSEKYGKKCGKIIKNVANAP
jgi:hypothetical protein